MTHSISNELISAWLDKEATEAEAQTVQAAIESDPDVARRVNEQRVLSGVLKSLPVEPVPQGFKNLVIEATQGVVRDPSELKSTRRSGRSGSPSTSRRWAIGASIATTAAMLFFAFNLSDRVNNSSRDQSSATIVAELAPQRSENAAKKLPLETDTNSSIAEMVVAADSSAGAEFEHPSAAPPAAALPAASFPGSAPPAFNLTDLKFDAPLKDADVGDVIEAIDPNGNQVSAIKLTVVDRNASVDRLEVLLAVHDGAKVTHSGRNDGMVLLVEAMPEDLAACFKQLQQEDLYKNMVVASTSVASQDLVSQIMTRNQLAGAAIDPTASGFGGGSDSSRGGFGANDESEESGNEDGVGAADADRIVKNAKAAANSPLARKLVKPEFRTRKDSRPIRLLIVLEPSRATETGEGNGATTDFRLLYGPIS